MGLLDKLVLWCLIWCAVFFVSLSLQFIRTCKNDNLIELRAVNRTHKYAAHLNGTEVRFTVTVSWDLKNPTEVPFDGFVVRFWKIDEGHFNSEGNLPSLTPLNECNPGQDHFWVTTTNKSVCSNVSGCSNSEQCLCNLDCPLTGGIPSCRGVNFWLADRGWMSVPAKTRNLTFDVEYLSPYEFDIFPYYREVTGNFSTNMLSRYHRIQAINDCSKLVQQTTGSSQKESQDLCCHLRHSLIRNTSSGSPLLDYKRDSVNISVSWLPPLTRDNLVGFRILLNYVYSGTILPVPLAVKPVRRVDHQFTDELSYCDSNLDHYYTTTVYNLKPGFTYSMVVSPDYAVDSAYHTDCLFGWCDTEFDLQIPEMNPCDKQWKYCDINSNCTAVDVTGFTLNVTCTCHKGYKGNGINYTLELLGDGCSDINSCLQEEFACASSATCTDFPAPEMGRNCSCGPGYFGDGHVNGTGCSSTTLQVLQIVLPIVAVIIIIVCVILWRVQIHRNRQNDLKWSQFVANENFSNYASLLKTIDVDGIDCNPTFGAKWEVDRDRLIISDVLGRGNYGVVHRASYNIDPCVDVAVKLVKEGANQEVNEIEFLTEIGFMLNVGDHPNVLKVIGCCTTMKPIMLVTEFLKYGDLLHFLWDSREVTKCDKDPAYHVTEKSLLQMAHQVATGMDYLTKSRIIHGDLAARNILVGEGLKCQISDFGLANDVYRYGAIHGQSERCVPFKWISPERMMAGKLPITSKSDVWSFGNLMYEMITLGCMPHPDIESDKLLNKLKDGYRMDRPVTCSAEMYSIMSKCWKWRPSARPSFFTLVKIISDEIEAIKDVDYINLAVQNIDMQEYDEDINQQRQTKADDIHLDTKTVIFNGYSSNNDVIAIS